MRKIKTPLTYEIISSLHAGDEVLLSGNLHTARDQAHKRLYDALGKNMQLPFDINNIILYYTGPTPAKKGKILCAGPTSSYRMDCYTPMLLNNGIKGMIGKGDRSDEVIESIKKNKCIYFAAIGGAGALISRSIKNVFLIAYEDLGPEAIYKFEIEDMYLIVAIDSYGNNIYR